MHSDNGSTQGKSKGEQVVKMPNTRLPNERADDAQCGWDERFGVCPECRHSDGYINIGRDHWLFCKEHKVKWYVGSNLFSSWKDETGEEQKRIFDDLDFGNFTEVRECHPNLEAIDHLAEQVHAITHHLMDIPAEDVYSSPSVENLLAEVHQLLEWVEEYKNWPSVEEMLSPMQ